MYTLAVVTVDRDLSQLIPPMRNCQANEYHLLVLGHQNHTVPHYIEYPVGLHANLDHILHGESLASSYHTSESCCCEY